MHRESSIIDSNVWLRRFCPSIRLKAQSGALLLLLALSSEKGNVAVGVVLIGHCTHLSPPHRSGGLRASLQMRSGVRNHPARSGDEKKTSATHFNFALKLLSVGDVAV